MANKPKSLKLNMALNALKGVMGVLFPLITFPYVTRILGVDNVGRYNFANSIINYFVLISGLGIGTYAIREGARIRDKSDQITEFVGEMFSLNIVSTLASYILFAVVIVFVPKLHEYKALLLILSIQIGFRTIGVEWLYSIYEDYLYITVRSIAFQFLSLALLFIIVKTPNDLNVYAGITVLSAVGSNILNLIHSRKYCKIGIFIPRQWKRHISSIMLLFAMAVAVTIYVASDTTMLGFMCDDYTVGIYSVSTKVYTIVKTILSSVLVVSVPRLSSLLGKNNRNEYDDTASDILRTLYTVVLPSITGLICLRKEIVLIISSEEYISAIDSLSILGIALFFCLGAWFWGQCILVPNKLEKELFIATVVSAIINVALNFALIPLWGEKAAACTTVVAEGVTFVWCMHKGRKYVNIQRGGITLLKVLIGCAAIMFDIAILSQFSIPRTLFVVISIVCSVAIYCVVEILLKNEAITSMLTKITDRFAN